MVDARRPNGDDGDERGLLFKQYWEHASALRGWFVIYGLGGIALFLTEAEAVAKFSPGTRAAVTGGFMLAVAAQVGLAFMNKWTHWSRYWGDQRGEFKKSRPYKLATALSDRVWIDFACDLISLLAALMAIFVLILAIAESPLGTVDPNMAR